MWAAAALLIAAAPPPVSPSAEALRLLLKPVPDCARSTGSDIVVCGRDRERERQTLPLAADPKPGDPRYTSVSRERNGLVEDQSAGGSLHCDSSVGAAAGSGCLARDHRRAKELEALGGANAPK